MAAARCEVSNAEPWSPNSMKANLYRPSLGPLIELSGSLAVLGWYGPYDAHEANSIAKANLAKLEDGALRFAFDCVFIQLLFRCASDASYGNCPGQFKRESQAQWIRRINWTLVLEVRLRSDQDAPWRPYNYMILWAEGLMEGVARAGSLYPNLPTCEMLRQSSLQPKRRCHGSN